MHITRKTAVWYILFHISVYYLWLLLWKNHTFLQAFGGNLFSITGPILSAICIFYVYKRTIGRIKFFWLLLFIGLVNYVVAELIWSYYEIFLRVDTPYPGWFDMHYIIFYLLFFTAIIYINKDTYYSIRLLIDALFFCVVITLTSWIFIFDPLLGLDISLLLIIVTVAYPALDVAILFGLFSLLFLSKYTFPKPVLSLFIVGGLLFVVLDFIDFYTVTSGNSAHNGFVSPLWTLALMILGLASLYYKGDYSIEKGTEEVTTTEVEHKNINFRKKSYIQITPNILLILILFVIYYKLEHQISTINQVVFILLIFLIIRHIIYIFDNNKMMIETRQNEKLYIISQMAASIAHEIRNPMTVVNGFLQLLKQDEHTPKSHQKHYILMLEELERAQLIITDYLSLAKPKTEKNELINIEEEINFVVNTMSSYGTLHGIEIKYHTQDPYYIYGNTARFRQVLVNIIKNAIEASNNGDKIDIIVHQHKQNITIKIRDYGNGMTQKQINQLGMPFYSTKDNGTGLGLTFCYNIIKTMGGLIHISSEIGNGTCFELIIPEMKQ